MSREAHYEEVGAARVKAEDILEQIGALSDACRELIGIVESATGGDDSSDAGRAATEYARLLEVAVTNEPSRLAEEVNTELVRYMGGF